MNQFIGRTRWLWRKSQTTMTRAFLGCASVLFGVFMVFSNTVHLPTSEYHYMMWLTKDNDWVWAIGFIINGSALLYGVYTQKFSHFLLWCEGLLGTFLWFVASAAMTAAQESPGASWVPFLIAVWVCYRYPLKAERDK